MYMRIQGGDGGHVPPRPLDRFLCYMGSMGWSRVVPGGTCPLDHTGHNMQSTFAKTTAIHDWMEMVSNAMRPDKSFYV